jgi:hypothetical protein
MMAAFPMAKTLYCWRCRTDIPMLEEHEWDEIQPHLTKALEEIKSYRVEHGVSVRKRKKPLMAWAL